VVGGSSRPKNKPSDASLNNSVCDRAWAAQGGFMSVLGQFEPIDVERGQEATFGRWLLPD